jgi:hypothetical protein
MHKGATMNKRFASPQFILRLLIACGISLLIALGSSTAIAASNSDACTWLKPSDLSALFGGTPISKSNGSSCRWTASASNKTLIVANVTPKNTYGAPMQVIFASAQKNAHDTGKVTNESGLGDKAFSVVSDSGMVVLMIIRHDRLLQLQYVTGSSATAKDVDELMPIAKKAIVAF